jgi:tRNA U34 5-methylaminomethyl-2-thiouridine-forming methyltransferase MnmC
MVFKILYVDKMMSKLSNNSLTPQKQALSIINHYFQKEMEGDINARDQARKELLNYLIKTDDGSYTLKSDEMEGSCETMHTSHGAITESLEKFVKPSLLDNKDNLKVLDICSGFGYNSAALISYLDADNNPNIEISLDLVEISIETLAGGLLVPSPLPAHDLIKKAIEKKLIRENYARFSFEKKVIPENIKFNIFSEDAREVIVNLESNSYDAIFLDPFSPSKAPELYTVEFFKQLKRILKYNGILTTYTSAAPVRYGLVESGFHIGEGPAFGRKSGGTVASLFLNNIKTSISDTDERMIALSDAGIPFRDPFLDLSGDEILKNRSKVRMYSRGKYKLSSTVKSPIFLGKDIEMDRLGRRVLKNINQLNIDNLKSEKALYLICPQFDSCICGCNMDKIFNSRDRIIKMAERLADLCK